MVAFVIVVEASSPSILTTLGIAMEIPFAIGKMFFVLEAYYFRDWKDLQMVSHLPVLACGFFWFLIPESPRWLLSVGKVKKATEIMKKAMEMNEVETKEKFRLKPFEKNQEDERVISAVEMFKPMPMFWRINNMFYQVSIRSTYMM